MGTCPCFSDWTFECAGTLIGHDSTGQRPPVTQTLLPQLSLATAMVALTILIHLVGLGLLLALLRAHGRRFSERQPLPQALVILTVVLGLFALHAVEIWSYAALYAALRTFQDFEEALYFSTTTYTTIGYGDLTLPKPWRVLGAIEGANGIILLGWSTAFFFSVLQRIRTLEADWLQRDGDQTGGSRRRP
jgi:voltage-gated potassium channel